MQFIPICLECKNFKKENVCLKYGKPPFEIKNREVECEFFTGGEYDLLTAESEPEKVVANERKNQ